MNAQPNTKPHKAILKFNPLSSHERAKLFGAFLKGWLNVAGLSSETLAQKLHMDIDLLMDIFEGVLPVSMIDNQLIEDLSAILGVPPALLRLVLGDVCFYPDELATDDLLYKLLREGDITPWFDSSQSSSSIEEALTGFQPEVLFDEAMFSDVIPSSQEDETQNQYRSSSDELRWLVIRAMEEEYHRQKSHIKSSISYLEKAQSYEVTRNNIAVTQAIEEIEQPFINEILEDIKNEAELYERIIGIYNMLIHGMDQQICLMARKEAIYRQKQKRQHLMKRFNFTYQP